MRSAIIAPMEKIRVAVIGVGHLGHIHAKIYSQLAGCSLEGVCDINRAKLAQVSQELGVPAYEDHKDLFGKVDAVSICVPTAQHYEVAADFLMNNIDTLVEKPFTSTMEQAQAILKIAKSNKRILQVGHVERFNSAFTATVKLIQNPKFIECHRLSPFPHRSLDVGAVLDIMIHDIDIILGLVPSRIKRIESVGINVLTPFEDIANARLVFENGCVANLTASRISDDTVRKIRIFQEHTYISLDYKDAKATLYRKAGQAITKEDLPIEKEQPLQKELEHFLSCVRTHTQPMVSGEVAAEALRVALEIQHQIWPHTRKS
jgi:predicted dehydrogenase